jgi:hypothetical protein
MVSSMGMFDFCHNVRHGSSVINSAAESAYAECVY